VADVSQTQLPAALVQGLAFWETDKPTMLMQYSCSSSFDGDINLDPMMIAVQPDNTWTSSAVAMTVRAEQYTQHRVSMLFRTNINDQRYAENLASIRANGNPVFAAHVRDNVHVAEFTVEAGQQTPNWEGQYLFSANENVSMSGMVYGNSFVDAYGWGLAGGVPQNQTSTGPYDSVTHGFAGITHDQRNSLLNITLDPFLTSTAVTITDMLGRVLYSLPVAAQQQIVVPVADYSAGLAIVIVRAPSYSWSKAVMLAP